MPVRDMGIECSRGGVLQHTGNNDSGRTTKANGPFHDRHNRRRVRTYAHHAIVGFIARSQRRTRCRRVGNPVIGRARNHHGHILCPIEGCRLIITLDREHRHLAQPHSVADQIDQVPDWRGFIPP